MGSAVSSGTDNDDLIDNLLVAEYIKTPTVERVFRAVDRAFYYLPEYQDNAYRDLAWKNGNIHLSAPCVYCEVMESLELAPGLSFLNVGSGTGYFSTMVGLILGPNGTNHGIEMFEDVVQYANMKLDEFKRTSSAIDSFDFCEPKFVKGNGFCLPSGSRQYDRVYCGAACPETHDSYVRNLIKVGGILVMPLNHHLLQITRKSETEWSTNIVLPVSFATLRIPSTNEARDTVSLPEQEPMTLQEVCRFAIRRLLRANAEHQYPELCKQKPRKMAPKKRKRLTRKQVIANIFESSDDDSDNVNARNVLALRPNSQANQQPTANSRNPGDNNGMPLLVEVDESSALDEDEEDDGLEEEFDEEEEEEEEDEEKEKDNEKDGDDETASQSSIPEQRKKVAKREKFDSGLGDEVENGKGLTSDESDDSSLDRDSVMAALVMTEDPRTIQALSARRTIHALSASYYSRFATLSSSDDVDKKSENVTSLKKVPSTSNQTDSDVSYGRIMRNSIMQLPLPVTLKSYLNFCREF